MHTDILKIFFPDLLSLEKAIIKGGPKDFKTFNNIIKVLVEDAELFKHLAHQ